uniref:Meiotic recombination protein SPO11-2 n=1 Tax=Zea mays subsp. mays TaxID=381124 RepID=A0A1P8W1E5_MAIZE|nr:initiator of meiotic double stranded breaks SPO11-2 [Zea mays subsp. mays]APZ84716.1 initiator of meiotic double stranded breaks SPO11-2 [Zea mays subsp. mays]
MAEANVAAASLFGADGRLCSADILAPPEVRARIEVAVLNFLAALASPSSPAISVLPLISRSSANCSLRSGLLNDVSSVYLSYTFCKRSLTHNPKAFVRVWKVMEMCYKILGEGKLVQQRELFYKLLSDSPKYFSCQRHVNQAIQDVVSLLRCTRQSLGVMASSRGALIGRLVLHEPDGEQIDCSILGASGHAITGDLNLLSKLNLSSGSRYIIVVEKDAVFQRLAEDRLYNQLPCILITAKGYPDIATRFILHRLSQTFPNMPIFALVDWNPAGLAILCTYKYGSISMGLESYRYACNVKWLGVRGGDLHLIPEGAFQELKPRDLQIAKGLMSSKFLQESHRAELALMVERGKRADIEALYSHGFDFLGKYIARKIVQGDYI